MEIRKEKIAKIAQQNNLRHDEFVASHERTLKTAAKEALNRKLYLDGYSKGLQGIPFDSFTDLIEYNGKKIKRKDHPGFTAGYEKGSALRFSQEANNNHKTR